MRDVNIKGTQALFPKLSHLIVGFLDAHQLQIGYFVSYFGWFGSGATQPNLKGTIKLSTEVMRTEF